MTIQELNEEIVWVKNKLTVANTLREYLIEKYGTAYYQSTMDELLDSLIFLLKQTNAPGFQK